MGRVYRKGVGKKFTEKDSEGERRNFYFGKEKEAWEFESGRRNRG